MTGYSDTIRHWAIDLRRAGIITAADGTGEVGLESHEAGRRLAVRFTIKLAAEKVADVRFQVFGCGFTIAACAVTAELAINTDLDALAAIDAARVDDVLKGLPDERSYCADLAVEALQAAANSARAGQTVQSAIPAETEHGPRVHPEHPVYAALINSPAPADLCAQDRQLFACLLAVANDEPYSTATALGLTIAELDELQAIFFPSAEIIFHKDNPKNSEPPPEANPDILSILLSHVPGDAPATASHLARILAARAAHPGHLWVAMGLFERPQLSAAIRRHLPSLATANNRGMRWKRYLFKQVCDLNDGVMCKVPDCGECSDYALCFTEE